MVLIGTLYLVLTAATLTIVVTLRAQHTPSALIGLTLTGSAVGVLLGSRLVGPLHQRMAPGRLLVLVCAVVAAAVAALIAPLGTWWVFGALVLATLTVPALRVLIDILILRQVPEERRGRTIVAVMTTLTIGPPLGTLLAGMLLQFAGADWTLAALAALQAAAAAHGLCNPHVRRVAWPQ
jgi:MFS family permease